MGMCTPESRPEGAGQTLRQLLGETSEQGSRARLHPDENPSPFPDAHWREFAQEYNREQELLDEIFRRLNG